MATNLRDACRLRRLKIAANTAQKFVVVDFSYERKKRQISTLSNAAKHSPRSGELYVWVWIQQRVSTIFEVLFNNNPRSFKTDSFLTVLAWCISVDCYRLCHNEFLIDWAKIATIVAVIPIVAQEEILPFGDFKWAIIVSI